VRNDARDAERAREPWGAQSARGRLLPRELGAPASVVQLDWPGGPGRRYIGVEKLAGRDEWCCRINSSLRFKSEKEAAWGHDVITLGQNPQAGDEELNFAESSGVVRNVLKVVQICWNQAPT